MLANSSVNVNSSDCRCTSFCYRKDEVTLSNAMPFWRRVSGNFLILSVCELQSASCEVAIVVDSGHVMDYVDEEVNDVVEDLGYVGDRLDRSWMCQSDAGEMVNGV